MKTESHPGLVVGIDCSTSAVKAIAWNYTGQVIAVGRTPLNIQTPLPGFYEQRAEDWWAAACLALRQVTSSINPDHIQAIAITHQRETFVPLGVNLKPLRPAILWMDQRAHSLLPDFAALVDAESFHRRTGKPLSANLAAPKIEWLRCNEPSTYQQTAFWLDTHAYLVHKLSGQLATSTGSADPLGLYDLSTGQWDAAILDAIHLDASSLPRVYDPGTLLGVVTSQTAAETGLNAGTPIAAGIGDGQAAVLGAGINRSGALSLSLGTSVIGGCFSPDYKTSTAFRTTSGCAGTFIFETVILSGTQILDWIALDLLGGGKNQQSLAEIGTAAAAVPAGSEGLVLVPYWNGAMNPYWDSSASGILVGLRGHHRSGHIFRAALEGIAFELRLQLEGLESALSSPISELIVSGGGSQSPLWLQIIADVTRKIVHRKVDSEAASLGAAILAAQITGFFSNVTETIHAMTGSVQSSCIPSPTTSIFYTQQYSQCYRPLYPAIRPILKALGSLID